MNKELRKQILKGVREKTGDERAESLLVGMEEFEADEPQDLAPAGYESKVLRMTNREWSPDRYRCDSCGDVIQSEYSGHWNCCKCWVESKGATGFYVDQTFWYTRFGGGPCVPVDEEGNPIPEENDGDVIDALSEEG